MVVTAIAEEGEGEESEPEIPHVNIEGDTKGGPLFFIATSNDTWKCLAYFI